MAGLVPLTARAGLRVRVARIPGMAIVAYQARKRGSPKEYPNPARLQKGSMPRVEVTCGRRFRHPVHVLVKSCTDLVECLARAMEVYNQGRSASARPAR